MGKRKFRFSGSTIKKLMKEAGATRIAKDSIEFMSGLIEGYVKSTTGKAVIFMEHAKRKILTSKDLELTQLNP